jgi:hypothetical protein
MKKYKVVFTGEDGQKREYLLPPQGMWLNFGNFSGMGQFKKLKIKEVDDEDTIGQQTL